MRLRTRGALAALPLVLALSLAGCGGEEKESGIPQGGNGTAGGGKNAAAGMSPEDRAVKFAECMRKNGIDMEDPKPGQGIQLRGNKGDEQQMKKAQEACRQYDPMAQQSGKPDPEAEERGRKFAECMRKNGVEKFPDPEPGQRGVRITGEAGKDPDMDAAMEKCRQEAPMRPGGGAGGGGGRQ
ncbi:hypothetical protein GCM10010191_54400 [Actinomadura vinacea]|uniref:Uncharacterized protein n=1 Tax=Actinomadura vinacea TaxID=115336 RepID=A0ABN3JNI2_9ACTN